jgi:hypothetical protein
VIDETLADRKQREVRTQYAREIRIVGESSGRVGRSHDPAIIVVL